jgi:voltage-gated potassium channel
MLERVYQIVEKAEPGDKLSLAFDIFITVLILLNVAMVVVETVEETHLRFGLFFRLFEIVSVLIFTVEYVLRVASCNFDVRYRRFFWGNVKYIFSFMALVDLFAILPFYLPMVFPVDLRFLRAFRLLRFFRILRAKRYVEALQLLKKVFYEAREELITAFTFVAILLLIGSTLVYYFENPVQPDAFPNVPATLWWGVMTLTTVGYGDVTPVTTGGKIVASAVAVLGLLTFAIPTAILGTEFLNELRKKREREGEKG